MIQSIFLLIFPLIPLCLLSKFKRMFSKLSLVPILRGLMDVMEGFYADTPLVKLFHLCLSISSSPFSWKYESLVQLIMITMNDEMVKAGWARVREISQDMEGKGWKKHQVKSKKSWCRMITMERHEPLQLKATY